MIRIVQVQLPHARWQLARPSSLSEVAPMYRVHGRHFSSCPFQTLGLNSKISAQSTPAYRVEHAVTYEQVQIAFRELALKHHPDTNSNNESGDNSSENFNRIREAFEAIAEGPNGIAVVPDEYSEAEQRKSVNVMNVPDGDREKQKAAQNEQNGFLHSSVNPKIFREVADVAEKMNPGGLDRGGMWQYANMIRNMADKNEDGIPPLRISGIPKTNDEKAGKRRRRRRRK
mmetsp:Transcript_26427/g.56199  ORF Transcript_26427/g.56199 Transcript_26427/m.56199 type:complete len:229 (+) Transcript_26427:3-689(+)